MLVRASNSRSCVRSFPCRRSPLRSRSYEKSFSNRARLWVLGRGRPTASAPAGGGKLRDGGRRAFHVDNCVCKRGSVGADAARLRTCCTLFTLCRCLLSAIIITLSFHSAFRSLRAPVAPTDGPPPADNAIPSIRVRRRHSPASRFAKTLPPYGTSGGTFVYAAHHVLPQRREAALVVTPRLLRAPPQRLQQPHVVERVPGMPVPLPLHSAARG